MMMFCKDNERSSNDDVVSDNGGSSATTETNFGTCEWCGNTANMCKCFVHDELLPVQWLEDTLGEMLEDDPSFHQMMANASAENPISEDMYSSSSGWCSNGGTPLCVDAAPLGVNTDGTAAHPVTPSAQDGNSGRLDHEQYVCTN